MWVCLLRVRLLCVYMCVCVCVCVCVCYLCVLFVCVVCVVCSGIDKGGPARYVPIQLIYLFFLNVWFAL